MAQYKVPGHDNHQHWLLTSQTSAAREPNDSSSTSRRDEAGAHHDDQERDGLEPSHVLLQEHERGKCGIRGMSQTCLLEALAR
jgi:hypothetical protein